MRASRYARQEKEYRKKMIAEFTAARGARLMDRTRPRWFLRVHRVRLNIESNVDCILGQEYGDYCRGRVALDIGPFRAACYGFAPLAPNPRGWDKLNVAWQAEIAARLTTRALDAVDQEPLVLV